MIGTAPEGLKQRLSAFLPAEEAARLLTRIGDFFQFPGAWASVRVLVARINQHLARGEVIRSRIG